MAKQSATRLVEAAVSKLGERYPALPVEVLLARAAFRIRYSSPDLGIDRMYPGNHGVFDIGHVAFHVQRRAYLHDLEQCRLDMASGMRAVFLTSRAGVERAKALAEIAGIEDALSVFALVDYLAHVMLGVAVERRRNLSRLLGELALSVNRAGERSGTTLDVREAG